MNIIYLVQRSDWSFFLMRVENRPEKVYDRTEKTKNNATYRVMLNMHH